MAMTPETPEKTEQSNLSAQTLSEKASDTQFTQLGRFLNNHQRWFVFLLLITLMTLHTRDIYLIPPESAMPMTWLGYGAGGLITLAVKRYKEEPLSRFLLYSTIVGLMMSGNYLLYQSGIILPSYVVFISVTGLLLVVDILNRDQHHLLLKAGVVVVAVALFFAVDYDRYESRLLKDYYLDRHIRRTFELKAPLTEEDLASIDGFSISRFTHVSRLDGIEHFTNLDRLYIWEASVIRDLSQVAQLPQLETLMLGGANLDVVNQLPMISTLKTLELVYPDEGRLETLAQFPNLVELDLQGVHSPLHYENLSQLALPANLHTLGIADTPTFSLGEAAHFPQLQTLRFYQVLLQDVEEMASMDALNHVRLQGTHIEDQGLFYEIVQQKTIELDDWSAQEDFVIELP